MPKKRQQKKGTAQNKRRGGGSDADGATMDVDEAKGALLKELGRVLEEEEGGDDSYDDLEGGGGIECVAEMALDEVVTAAAGGGAEVDAPLWDLAPDTAEVLRAVVEDIKCRGAVK